MDATTTILLAIIAALVAVTPAVLTYLTARRTNVKVTDLAVKVDGRLTELLEQTARAQHASGRREGIDAASSTVTPDDVSPPARGDA